MRPLRLPGSAPSLRAVALAAFVLAIVGTVAAPGRAAASCMEPPPMDVALEEAGSVFVGTVTALRADNRWATVRVTEVWRGPDLPEVVEVRGGAELDAFSSVDRTYEAGRRYLFLASIGEGQGGGAILADNACSRTTEWTEDLSQFRPDAARAPIGTTGDGQGTDAQLGPIVIAVVVVLAVAVVLFGAVAALRRS